MCRNDTLVLNKLLIEKLIAVGFKFETTNYAKTQAVKRNNFLNNCYKYYIV